MHDTDSPAQHEPQTAFGFHGVRYQVSDVARAVAFYTQQLGGWNRIVLRVPDLPARIDALRKAGTRLRNEMEVGPGGRQIQLEDPDGNPVELFEPARR